MRTPLLTVAVLAAIVLTAGADDWPRFRGPNGSGYAPAANTPAKFTEKDFNWNISLPGIGHASPVVFGRRVFVPCAEPETAKRYLICVDLASGKELWRNAYGVRGFPQHKDNSFASASAVVDAER